MTDLHANMVVSRPSLVSPQWLASSSYDRCPADEIVSELGGFAEIGYNVEQPQIERNGVAVNTGSSPVFSFVGA